MKREHGAGGQDNPRGRQWIIAGLFIALPLVGGVMAVVAVAFGALVGSQPEPTPRKYAVPPYANLLTCTAAFSSQVIYLKSVAGDVGTRRLKVAHRNYRRLHRLMRQVGRRDGIEPDRQSAMLRTAVGEAPRSVSVSPACAAIAALPIARRRLSQIEIGRSSN